MTVPRESWLRSPDHEKWAEAMMVCRHPFVLCGGDGHCHYGDCFKRSAEQKALDTTDDLRKKIEMLERRIEDLESK